MEVKFLLLITYTILGGLLVLFNKSISDLNYKLVLYYTNKLHLKDFFIFKINHKNKDSMHFLTRAFTFVFGLAILLLSLYNLFNY